MALLRKQKEPKGTFTRLKMAASLVNTRRIFLRLLIWLLLSVLAIHVAECKKELKQAHILFRHGNRSPIGVYKTDKITTEMWPQGLGQLTDKGMEQHYMLGKWLHNRYVEKHKLLSHTYKRSEIYIRSTAYDRTIMSAQSCLAGLYEVNASEPIYGLRWHPIPVWTVKKDTDYFLNPNGTPCPRLKELAKHRAQSDEVLNYVKANKTFFDMVQKETGLSPESVFGNYTRVGDAVIMERLDGRKSNTWAQDETVYKKLEQIVDYGHEIAFKNPTAEETRLRSGLLIKEIYHSFQDIVTDSKHHNAHIFSGHDTTLAPFLAGIGQFDNKRPTTASCVLLELYQDTDKNGDKKYFVEMYFRRWRNDTEDEPPPMRIKHCSNDTCPLEEFNNLVKNLMPEDIEKECTYKANTPSTALGKFIIFTLLFSCVILLLAIVVCLFRGSRGRVRLWTKKKRFEPINFQLLGNPGSDSEDGEVFDP